MEARGLALPHADTEYVCFVDNDVVVTHGWLNRLLRCADETEAWAVGPLCFNGNPADGLIHTAGGEARIVEEHGRRAFFEQHRFPQRHLHEVVAQLGLDGSERVEFRFGLDRRGAFVWFVIRAPRWLS